MASDLVLTMEQLEAFANQVANSDFAPKDFRGKPANCLIAMMMGREVGLQPLAALQSIAVVNGRPSLWGDGALAVVQASGLVEAIEERCATDALAAKEGCCVIRRRGNPAPITGKFTVADAQKAGLWGKAGPWSTNPGRMLQMRARAFALRDGFADVLKGLGIGEEALDIQQGEVEVVMPRSRSGAPVPEPGASMLPPPTRHVATPETAPTSNGHAVAEEPPVDDSPSPMREKVGVVGVDQKTSSKGKPYYVGTFRDIAGQEFTASTFSETLAGAVQDLAGAVAYVRLEAKTVGGKTHQNILDIEPAL
jgi:hypothetical protein